MSRKNGDQRGATALKVQTENESEADQSVREALKFIERLARRANLELVIEIGDYLVEKFFGGQLDLARSYSPTKPMALKRLEKEAPRHEISVSQLRIAIALSAQYRSLPGTVRDRLTVRQHRALLPVHDNQEKSRLARRAVSEKLSGDALASVVRAEVGPARKGRKAQGELERALTAGRRALVSSMVENALEPAKLRTLDAELKARLLRDARTLRERIERIADALSGAR